MLSVHTACFMINNDLFATVDESIFLIA